MTFDELITGIRQSEPAITHVDFSQISDFQNEHGQYMPPDFSRASSHYSQYCELIDALRFSTYVTKLSFISIAFDFGKIVTLDEKPTSLSLLIDLLIDNPIITSLDLSESMLMEVDQLFQSLSDTAIQILSINKIITGQQHKEILESIATALETNTSLQRVHCAPLDSTTPEEAASHQLTMKVALLLKRNSCLATPNLADNLKLWHAQLIHQFLALPQIRITKESEVDLHLRREKPADRTDSFEPTSSHASDTVEQPPLPSAAAEPVLYPVNRSARVTSAEQPKPAKRPRIDNSSAQTIPIPSALPTTLPTISALYAAVDQTSAKRARIDKTLPSAEVEVLPTLPELFSESEVDIETTPYPVGTIDNKNGFFYFSPQIPSADPNNLDIQPK